MRTGINWMPARGEPTATLLLRHGQTPMSVQKRYLGRSDVPLTDIGVRQAVAAAKRLASAGLDVIVTSIPGATRSIAFATDSRLPIP